MIPSCFALIPEWMTYLFIQCTDITTKAGFHMTHDSHCRIMNFMQMLHNSFIIICSVIFSVLLYQICMFIIFRIIQLLKRCYKIPGVIVSDVNPSNECHWLNENKIFSFDISKLFIVSNKNKNQMNH